VLVRLLVEDDSRQTAQAEALAQDAADGGESVFVPLTVMLELEWVLRSRYGFPKHTVVAALVEMLETRELEFQDEGSVERALHFYRSQGADFAECLHLGTAVSHERLPFLTFDRQAAKLEGAQLIGA
jgi:predicted nucleic-acid-binding protein